jgi:tetratricopeptide (TPR) repeat protein
MKFYLLLIFLMLVFSPHSLFSQKYNQSEKSLDDAINMTYNCRFEDALNIVNDELLRDPNSLQWLYFKGMIYYRKWLLKTTFSRGEEDRKKSEILLNDFFDQFFKVSADCEEILKNNPNDTTALFYGGAAYGYIGIYHVKKGEPFKAASEGKKGLNFHETLLKISPRWTDVYLSLGIFNFYASDVPWYVKPVLWILGRSGDEDKAFDYLKLVAENGKLARYEAMELLMELCIRRKNYTMATELFEKLNSLFPGGRYYNTASIGLYSWEYNCRDYGISVLSGAVSYAGDPETVIDGKKELGVIYVILANSYWNRKNIDAGINCWKEVLNKNYLPDETDWMNLVLADKYLDSGNKPEAIKLYTRISRNEKESSYKRKAAEALKKLEAD